MLGSAPLHHTAVLDGKACLLSAFISSSCQSSASPSRMNRYHSVRLCFPDVARRLASEGRVRSGRLDMFQGCAWIVVLKRRRTQDKGDALSVDVQCEPTEASAVRAGWRVCDGGMSFSLICMKNRSRSLWRRWHRYGEDDRQPWSQNRSTYGWSHFADAEYVLNEANGFLFEGNLYMEVRIPVCVQLESPVPVPTFPTH